MNIYLFLFNLLFDILLYNVECTNLERDSNDILLLTKDTFQEAINEFKNLFVLMYIKDSSETQTSLSIIEDVGKKLKIQKFKDPLAKLSLDYDNDILIRYNIDTTAAFVAIMDHGERYVELTETLDKVEKIINFIKRKIEPPVIQIDDPDLLKSVIENSECTSVGFFENFMTSEYEEYKSNADWYYHCNHFATTNPDFLKYYRVEEKIPTIKVFKGCIHDAYDFPSELPLQGMHILKYFIVAMEPYVSKYGMSWLMKKTFKDPKFTLLLFVSKNDKNTESYINILEKYARRYRDEINFAYAEVDGDEDISILLHTFDIKPSDAPLLRAIELSNRYGNNTRKYKPKRKSINDDSVRRFIGDVYYKQLQPYLISQPLPNDWMKDPIVTIVSDNFRNVTEDPEKTVLIVFYDTENKYESLVKGQLLQLAVDLKKDGKNDIIIGKSNYVTNEYYGWHPNKFPGIILFPKGLKKVGVVYNMELFYENFKSFIESDGKINKDLVAENPNMDDEESKVIVEVEVDSNNSSQKIEL